MKKLESGKTKIARLFLDDEGSNQTIECDLYYGNVIDPVINGKVIAGHKGYAGEVANVIVDPDGRDLADADAAWTAARVLALQLLQGADSDPALFKAVIFVTDAGEEVVLEFPLTDALVAEPVTPPVRSEKKQGPQGLLARLFGCLFC